MNDQNRNEEGPPGSPSSQLRVGLRRLAKEDSPPGWHLGARLRNYFLTGLVIVGPVTITLYFAWWFINVTDAWIKPFLPTAYLPDTYLPFPVPGFGLVVGIVALTLIGALAANLLGTDAHLVRRADGRRHADRAQRLPRAEADFRIRHYRDRPRPGDPEGRAYRISLQGAVVDRVRDGRHDGRGRRREARRGERPPEAYSCLPASCRRRGLFASCRGAT